MIRERRFAAMGTDAHVIVDEAHHDALDAAPARIEELESRWSRFRADSEISRLNATPGRPVVLSAVTFAAVAAAIAAWRRFPDRFDPTVLDALERVGYRESVPTDLHRTRVSGPPVPAPGPRGIVLDPTVRAVTLPVGVHLDLGGIGKGLAADLVVADLMRAGATFALVNLGGDLRTAGSVPTPTGEWEISLDGLAGFALAITDAAVATSAITRRRWTTDEGPAHHVIDPRTGTPAVRAHRRATVVAPSATEAEVLATVALLTPLPAAIRLLDRAGASGIVIDGRGHLATTEDLAGISELAS